MAVWEPFTRTAAGGLARVERWLEAERGRLPLWAPVLLGAGICAWFALPTPRLWLAWALGWAAVGLLAWGLGRAWRAGAAIAIGGALLSAGCLLPWGKALLVGAPPLARPAMVEFTARVDTVEIVAARGNIRMRLAPVDRPDLPGSLRVSAKPDAVPAGLRSGATIALRAYLMPPPPAALPGGYDFSLRAWFEGIGATGRVIGPVRVVGPATGSGTLRERLAEHVSSRIEGGPGAIAVALASGDQGRISDADAEAMRRSGLAHLLSISGLHVSALIGAVIVIAMRVLALSPMLALRWPLPVVAAICGAFAGLFYTWLTGMQVPTVRSCVAALLVIGGLMMGREAISLRLVAAGALIVMLFWPEAVIGPSFQMSFAAVVALVALYEYPPARRFFERREERWPARIGRLLAALLATGLAVEITLAPIAIHHFHRAGLLGALANIIAIPLTSFVIMPAEALALIFDIAGLGGPFWLIVDGALRLLLRLAHVVAAQPFSVVPLPLASPIAFAVAMLGFLWLVLWHGPVRWAGGLAMGAGIFIMAGAAPPDILVTRDGRHVALRVDEARYALLRQRTGDYVRQTMGETLGLEEGALDVIDTVAQSGPDTMAVGGAAVSPASPVRGPATDAGVDVSARVGCSSEACIADIPPRAGRGQAYGKAASMPVRLLAFRSRDLVPYRDLVAACAAADIVIADRRLPDGCQPRWLKLDRRALERSGGVAIDLHNRRLTASRDARDRHPWLPRPVMRGESGASPRPVSPVSSAR